MKLTVLSLLAAALGLAPSAWAKDMYYPTYGGPDGAIVEFKKGGFYITQFDENGDYTYDCEKISSLSPSMHWAQCKGGEKFLFTLDPKHPETMKIGDIVYTACGKTGEKCN